MINELDDPKASNADLSGYGNDLNNTITGNDGDNRLQGDSGDDRLLGKAGDDRLEGGSGDDWLDGGLGRDRLEGGSGDDLFYFGDLLGSSNVDTIVDFNRHDDRFLLDNDVFVGLSAGSLQSAAFKVLEWGSHVDSSDRILYNAQSGDLFFDRDGSGTTYDAIRFADIANKVSLSASDFLIV
jgi:Ca2+-binding RTX toxin-like protein